jgi:hypothetical protein
MAAYVTSHPPRSLAVCHPGVKTQERARNGGFRDIVGVGCPTGTGSRHSGSAAAG